MALAAVDLELKYGYGAWVRTTSGWIPAVGESQLEPKHVPNNAITLRPVAVHRSSVDNKESRACKPIIVQGTRGQRQIRHVCLSEMLKVLKMEEAALEIRRSAYVYEVLFILMRDNLQKVSGTTHRLLFQILEAMAKHALSNEQHIDKIKTLTVTALKSLLDLGTSRVGCSSLWNKHVQTVTNICTQLEKFEVTERAEDGNIMFMDLPKECIREIMTCFSDHRNLLHLGQCNVDLYYMTQDMLLWEQLAQYHFTEKQMLHFLCEEDIGEGTDWKSVYEKCQRKYGLKQVYAESIGLCSKCKVLHWMNDGHECWGSEDVQVAEIEHISPAELLQMLRL